jgi:hypothetical protein
MAPFLPPPDKWVTYYKVNAHNLKEGCSESHKIVYKFTTQELSKVQQKLVTHLTDLERLASPAQDAATKANALAALQAAISKLEENDTVLPLPCAEGRHYRVFKYDAQDFAYRDYIAHWTAKKVAQLNNITEPILLTEKTDSWRKSLFKMPDINITYVGQGTQKTYLENIVISIGKAANRPNYELTKEDTIKFFWQKEKETRRKALEVEVPNYWKIFDRMQKEIDDYEKWREAVVKYNTSPLVITKRKLFG